MKIFRRFLFLIVAFSCLFLPQVTNSYDFESKGKEEKVKATRREIYDLYNVYKEVVKSSNNNSSQFGVMNYNGVCNMVTVDGTTIPLDDYIAGVIKQEMGGNNLEALKAQAIAARSFLLGTKADSSSCSVDNGQNYQAYTQDNDSNSIYKQAALETSGMVVSRNGKVAVTQYVSHPDKNSPYSKEVDGHWILTFQRFNDDPSTEWIWTAPTDKNTVRTIAGGGYLYGTDSLGDKSHHYGMSQTVAMYLAKGQNYTYDQLIKLFYNEPIVSLTDGNYTGDISYVDSEFGKVVYWNQGDYKNYYYSSDASKCTITQGGCATIASHGCGPTSAAIVASSILQRSITPIEMTEKVCQAGGCTSSGSYNDTLGKVLKNNYGLNVKMSNSDQEVINALGSKNALVIVLMGPGTFTTGGHYIVLTGVNSQGQVSVADPGNRKRTETKWFSFNTIVEQRKTYANYTIVTR